MAAYFIVFLSQQFLMRTISIENIIVVNIEEEEVLRTLFIIIRGGSRYFHKGGDGGV